jgi:light-regulated signal transduction histidine kinase (bacteriophytochrome)
MISAIVILDSITLIASLLVFGFLIKTGRHRFTTDIKTLVASLSVFNLMYSLCLLFEWSGITSALEPYEDLIGALIPMMWAFLFYVMLQSISEEELKKYKDHLENLVKERTKKLERANRNLSEFAYIVSHDLKAPLRAIGQLSQWIAEDNYEGLDEGGRKNIDLLKDRVKRMYRLIDDILAYSRAGRAKEEIEEIDMMKLARDVIDSLIVPENIHIKIENTLPVITGSRVHFQQVFQNLLSNAIKFMDKQEGLVSIGCIKKVNFWKFRIQDNGPGIDNKYKEKIFQIFQVLSPDKSTDSTGIGLTLVKKIVEIHGGEIDMISEVGRGCTFYFTLPV